MLCTQHGHTIVEVKLDPSLIGFPNLHHRFSAGIRIKVISLHRSLLEEGESEGRSFADRNEEHSHGKVRIAVLLCLHDGVDL